MVKPDDLAARIAVIKQEFLTRLKTDWVPALRAMRQGFLATPGDTALRNRIIHAAHDMTGSGAIFGYQKITDRGRQLEDRLRKLVRQEIEDTPACHAEILALLDQLEQACVTALADLEA